MIIYNRFIPFRGFRAISLFGVVFARREYGPLPARTLKHEAIHAHQWLWLTLCTLNPFTFYLLYLLEYMCRLLQYGGNTVEAYRNISFEREAYAHQDEDSYMPTPLSWTRHIRKK